MIATRIAIVIWLNVQGKATGSFKIKGNFRDHKKTIDFAGLKTKKSKVKSQAVVRFEFVLKATRRQPGFLCCVFSATAVPYSSFNVFEGLLSAALQVSQLIVANAINSNESKGNKNCHQLKETRNAYPCSH